MEPAKKKQRSRTTLARPLRVQFCNIHPLPQPTERVSSSTTSRSDAESAEERLQAGSDKTGAHDADGDTSRAVYAPGSIGVHVENTLYWSALPLNRSGSVAHASDLDKVWTAFFKGLNVADLTAACKTRSLPVVATTGSAKKTDFVTALQAWMHSHSRVISSFHDAQPLGTEDSSSRCLHSCSRCLHSSSR